MDLCRWKTCKKSCRLINLTPITPLTPEKSCICKKLFFEIYRKKPRAYITKNGVSCVRSVITSKKSRKYAGLSDNTFSKFYSAMC